MGAIKLDDIPHYTYDDYKLWSGEWELIYGVAYAMSPAPMIEHQSISSNLNEVKQSKLSYERISNLLEV